MFNGEKYQPLKLCSDICCLPKGATFSKTREIFHYSNPKPFDIPSKFRLKNACFSDYLNP